MNAVTLVTTMAQDNLDAFQGCYKLVVERLDKLIFDGDYPSEYVYYKVRDSRIEKKGEAEVKVPNPWLQIKILRLLQYYPPPGQLLCPDIWIKLIGRQRTSDRHNPRNSSSHHRHVSRYPPERSAQQRSKCSLIRSNQPRHSSRPRFESRIKRINSPRSLHSGQRNQCPIPRFGRYGSSCCLLEYLGTNQETSGNYYSESERSGYFR
jgi:hypothetical protein